MSENDQKGNRTLRLVSKPMRWLITFCFLTSIGGVALFGMVYREEGWTGLTITGGTLFILLFGVTGYWRWIASQKIRFTKADLYWYRPGLSPLQLPYSAIDGIEKGVSLRLQTGGAAITLRSPMPDSLARIHKELSHHTPHLNGAYHADIDHNLPITFSQPLSQRLGNILLPALFGLVLIAVGVAVLILGVDEPTAGRVVNLFKRVIIGLLTLLVGLGLGYLGLFNYVWVYRFTESEIVLQHPFRSKRYRAIDLKSMRLKKEVRTIKGFPRDAWQIRFETANGTHFMVEGSENGGMTGYTPFEDYERLKILFQRLKPIYFPKNRDDNTTGNDRPASNRPVNRPPSVKDMSYTSNIYNTSKGKPVLFRRTSKLYNFECQAVFIEERSAGAERIDLIFNRPVAGFQKIQTINGQAALSPNGRYLALWSLGWMLILDLATEKRFRLRDRTMWHYREARFDEQHLRVTLSPNDKPKELIPLTPIPLEEIEAVLTAESGPWRVESRVLLESDRLHMLLNLCHLLPYDQFMASFETLRDWLAEIGPQVVPEIVTAARQPKHRPILELLVYVLSDYLYPPAAPDFVRWLSHENDEILFASAIALDKLANGRFGIEKMIEGGWVQYDKIRATAPHIEAWWDGEGSQKQRSHTAWLAEQERKRPLTEREKWFNFVELNRTWVKQGDGIVQHPVKGYEMPRNKGIHTLAGSARLNREEKARFAAIEVDSADGAILSVNIKEDGVWIDVRNIVEQVELNHQFASVDTARY